MLAQTLADLMKVAAVDMGVKCEVFCTQDMSRHGEWQVFVQAPHHNVPQRVPIHEAPTNPRRFVEWLHGLIAPPPPPDPTSFAPEDSF